MEITVERPDYDSALPKGVNPSSIIANYIEAIGGLEKVKAIVSKKEIASATMQGMTLEIASKKNQSATIIAFGKHDGKHHAKANHQQRQRLQRSPRTANGYGC